MSKSKIGSSLFHLEFCTNSMDAAKEYLSDMQHGTILSIKNLAAARGRQGRVWTLVPGQLVMTFVLKPEQSFVDRADSLHYLFMALSLAILEPLKQYGAGLKWPNDIILCNKKLAGILMESVWQETQLQGLVIGFAINVNNQFAVDNPLFDIATSLHDVAGREFDLQLLKGQLLKSLNKLYDQWCAQSYLHLFKNWHQAQALMGKSIKVHHVDGSIVQGLMHDLQQTGDLVLRDEQGNLHIIQYAQVVALFTA